MINKSLDESGYKRIEKKSEELVTSAGRMLSLELRPYQFLTDYIILMIKIKIVLDNVTETTKEVNGTIRKFQEGDVSISFDSWLITDLEGRWGIKPWVYFLKGLINKFIYRLPLEGSAPGKLVGDTAHIYVNLMRLFNSYKGRSEVKVSEEKVRLEMQAEIEKEQTEI